MYAPYDAETLEFSRWLHAQLVEAYATESEAWALERVARVMARLQRERPDGAPLTTEILWLSELTAFTAPGPYVYLSRRLLERCATDEPVAFVLAHEIAHHDLGHLQRFAGWAARVPRVGGAAVVAGAFRALEHTFYGPDMEHAADQYAIQLCLDAGYDGRLCATLFDVLEAHALDRGDLDAVYGPESVMTREADGEEGPWVEARRWVAARLRGYRPIRERKAAVLARVATSQGSGTRR